MFSKIAFTSIFLFAISLSNSCSDDTSFSLSSVQHKLSQEKLDVKQNSKVDILWLIDNSQSMLSAQQNLTENFNSFISNFSKQNLDFQIGVAAIDSYRANPSLTNYFAPNHAKLRDGDHTKQGSGIYILNNDSPDLISTFVQNASLGTKGGGDERAFSSLEHFFKEPFNKRFLRQDSHLAIIIVSDEDDLSYNGKENYATLKSDNKPDLYEVDRFVQILDNVTASTNETRRYSVSSIHIKDGDIDCLNQLKTKTQKYGSRYESFITASGGDDNNIISLCSDFSESLNNLSQTIIKGTLKSFFKIDRRPIVSTIKVLVNGKPVAQSINGSTGWIYENPSDNVFQITFSEDAVPASGATVDIQFDPFKYDDN